ATMIAGFLMHFTKKWVLLSLLWPAVINGIIVGVILTYAYDLGPLAITMSSVFIGEFAVMYVLGYPTYLTLRKNTNFLEFFRS
ncbi:MAG: QueT transporter family protein, partial [Tenericutes bacterium HGW-Tenericutes-3]